MSGDPKSPSQPQVLYQISGEMGQEFTALNLRDRIRNGTLTAQDQVAIVGTELWKPAGDYPALMRYFSLLKNSAATPAMPAASRQPAGSMAGRIAAGLAYPFGNITSIVFIIAAAGGALVSPLLSLVIGLFASVYALGVIRKSSEGETTPFRCSRRPRGRVGRRTLAGDCGLADFCVAGGSAHDPDDDGPRALIRIGDRRGDRRAAVLPCFTGLGSSVEKHEDGPQRLANLPLHRNPGRRLLRSDRDVDCQLHRHRRGNDVRRTRPPTWVEIGSRNRHRGDHLAADLCIPSTRMGRSPASRSTVDSGEQLLEPRIAAQRRNPQIRA